MQFHNRVSHKDVDLGYGNLASQLSGMNQKKWIKACNRLGLITQIDKGKGSHCRVVKNAECNPSHPDCLIMTIVKTQLRCNQREQVKKLVAYGKAYNLYTEKDVWEAIGIKVSTRKP